MSGTVIPFAPRGTLPPDIEDLGDDSMAENTMRAYRSDWRAWRRWLRERRIDLDEATDEDMATWLGRAVIAGEIVPATMRRRQSSVDGVLRRQGLPPVSGPHTRRVIAGAARRFGTLPRRRAKPLTTALLKRTVAAIGTKRPLDLRDRALLLTGWQGALRSSEIVSLDWSDFADMMPLGASLLLRESKGDRDRSGEVVTLPPARDEAFCPARALLLFHRHCPGGAPEAPIFVRAHRDLRGRVRLVEDGRLGARAISGILRRRMEAAGLDPRGFSSHSMRSGALTSAAAAGRSNLHIREHSRHRHSSTLDLYLRDVSQLVGSHPMQGLL